MIGEGEEHDPSHDEVLRLTELQYLAGIATACLFEEERDSPLVDPLSNEEIERLVN